MTTHTDNQETGYAGTKQRVSDAPSTRPWYALLLAAAIVATISDGWQLV